MEKEKDLHKETLESITEQELNKMDEGINGLFLNRGIETKEGDYLLKSEEEFSDGESEKLNMYSVEGVLNGHPLKITKEDFISRKNGTFNSRICLFEKVEYIEKEGSEYCEVYSAEVNRKSGSRDWLIRYKQKFLQHNTLPHGRQMQMFYEKISEEENYEDLLTFYKSLEEVAVSFK